MILCKSWYNMTGHFNHNIYVISFNNVCNHSINVGQWHVTALLEYKHWHTWKSGLEHKTGPGSFPIESYIIVISGKHTFPSRRLMCILNTFLAAYCTSIALQNEVRIIHTKIRENLCEFFIIKVSGVKRDVYNCANNRVFLEIQFL